MIVWGQLHNRMVTPDALRHRLAAAADRAPGYLVGFLVEIEHGELPRPLDEDDEPEPEPAVCDADAGGQ